MEQLSWVDYSKTINVIYPISRKKKKEKKIDTMISTDIEKSFKF